MPKGKGSAGLKDDVLSFEDRRYSFPHTGPGRKISRSAARDAVGDTLETLYSEHRYLASLLDTLEKQSNRLKPRRIPDYHLLLDIIDYLAHYPDQYHHPREDLLFGMMLEHDDEFGPELERLEREHRTLTAHNQELLRELTRIVAGGAVNRPLLLHSIERYCVAYRQHMDYESRHIFPRARGKLSPAERKILAAKTRHIDDPLFGPEVHYRYQRLERSMRARVEVASQELVSRELSAIESTIEKLSEVLDTAGTLKSAIQRQRRQYWHAQKETIRGHAQPGEGGSLVFLPLALMKNHGRQWREGIAEIRRIIRGNDSGKTLSGKNR